MDPTTAAPLMCAGVTVFNSLRGVSAGGTFGKANLPGTVAVVG